MYTSLRRNKLLPQPRSNKKINSSILFNFDCLSYLKFISSDRICLLLLSLSSLVIRYQNSHSFIVNLVDSMVVACNMVILVFHYTAFFRIQLLSQSAILFLVANQLFISVALIVFGAFIAGARDLSFDARGYAIVFVANIPKAFYLATINLIGKHLPF